MTIVTTEPRRLPYYFGTWIVAQPKSTTTDCVLGFCFASITDESRIGYVEWSRADDWTAGGLY